MPRNPKLNQTPGYLNALDDVFVRDVLRLALKSETKRFVIGNHDDFVGLAVHLYRLCPRARIAVAVRTKVAGNKLCRELAEYIDEQVTYSAKKWDALSRITVCTYYALATCPPDEIDVVLVPHAEDALYSHPYQVLGNLPRALRCAFQCVNQEFSEVDEVRLQSLFGLARRHDRISKAQRQSVTVVVIDSTIRPEKPIRRNPRKKKIAITALALKRKGIWHNRHRNSAIAKIANAFVQWDLATLKQAGISLAVQGESAAPDPDEQSLSVAILVESTEHARALLELLPKWELAAALPSESDEVESALDAREGAHMKIVTQVRAERDGMNADVIIRADATRSRISIREFPRSHEENAVPQAVIDFADLHSDRGKTDAGARIGRYEKSGWKVDISH